MHLHVLGICGTFMAGLALLARELGHEVEGSDANVYPPMSTQLQQAGIRLHDGYETETLPPDCDRYVIGNAISRGNPQFEFILEPFVFAAQFLQTAVVIEGTCQHARQKGEQYGEQEYGEVLVTHGP